MTLSTFYSVQQYQQIAVCNSLSSESRRHLSRLAGMLYWSKTALNTQTCPTMCSVQSHIWDNCVRPTLNILLSSAQTGTRCIGRWLMFSLQLSSEHCLIPVKSSLSKLLHGQWSRKSSQILRTIWSAQTFPALGLVEIDSMVFTHGSRWSYPLPVSGYIVHLVSASQLKKHITSLISTSTTACLS